MPVTAASESNPGAPDFAAGRPVDFGDLRRLAPIDASFGLGRGRPVDRFYIERFLDAHCGDVHGTVLEVAEDRYTRQFGGSRVTAAEVLHRDGRDGPATWVADLADGATLPTDRFDCFICTQTLQYVFDLGAAFATVHRTLRPGGTWLLTVPGISQISVYDRASWGEHWRFTPESVRRLLETAGFEDLHVEGHGNVLAAVSFLHGIACEDLTLEELTAWDDRYPVVITARGRKPG